MYQSKYKMEENDFISCNINERYDIIANASYKGSVLDESFVML